MLTREEYIMRKNELEDAMRQSRRDQSRAVAALNDEYELKLRDASDEYRRRRQAIFDERDTKRLEIDVHYKNIRRDLWSQDVALVSEWRAGLTEITPPSSGGVQLEMNAV